VRWPTNTGPLSILEFKEALLELLGVCGGLKKGAKKVKVIPSLREEKTVCKRDVDVDDQEWAAMVEMWRARG
jgi:hypothetical protein